MSLSKKDEYVLYNLKEDLLSDHPVHTYKVSKGYKPGIEYSRLLICNPYLVNSLNKQGVFPNKTNILLPPYLKDDLIRHFIRGYFDGDGSISLTGGCPSVSFISTEPVLDYIQDNMINNGVTDRIYPYGKRKPEQVVSNFKFGKAQSVVNFFHYIYDDSNRRLERKYNRFIEIFENKNILY